MLIGLYCTRCYGYLFHMLILIDNLYFAVVAVMDFFFLDVI